MTLATAWVWSGVLTMTASICLSISCSILRKSWYLRALTSACSPVFLSLWLSDSLRRLSSMSHRAPTLACLAACRMSLWPLPLQPMLATLSFSLGDLPSARASPPATQKPAPARVDCLRKSRRVEREVMRASRGSGNAGWGGHDLDLLGFGRNRNEKAAPALAWRGGRAGDRQGQVHDAVRRGTGATRAVAGVPVAPPPRPARLRQPEIVRVVGQQVAQAVLRPSEVRAGIHVAVGRDSDVPLAPAAAEHL